jgi:hypothetical protein
MRFRTLLACLLGTTAVAACGDDPQTFVDAGPIDATSVDSAVVDTGGCDDPAGLPVYLNRTGGQYQQGAEDPGTNRSTLVDGSTIVAPFGNADASWTAVVDCVEELLAPFHLRVTEVDPGNVDHLEIVVAGGRSVGVIGAAGVSQASPLPCAISRDTIHFVFPAELGASPPPAVICRLAAQAVGHAATLDFTPDCTDVMAFNVGPTCAVDVGFTDVDHLCGRNAPEPCVCNGDSSAQNSFRSLLVSYGACP